MLAYLVAFILTLAAVWLTIMLSHDPGYVLLSYGQHNLEMPLWLLVVGVLVFTLTILSIFWMLTLWRRFKKWLFGWYGNKRKRH